MANDNITFIPGRIKSAAKNDPYIAGVEDIEGAIGGIPDKEYEPEKHSGLGRKTLKLDGDSNVITQDDINQENTIYVISYDFDLNGETIEVPEGCIFDFDGGSLKNGTIVGQDTYINDVCGLGVETLFGEGIIREGTWRMNEGGGSFEQVQSDWNETNPQSKAYIKNKPSDVVSKVQSDWNQDDNTKPDYIKNKPTIPEAQVQSDWNQNNSSKKDFIKNKPILADVAASGSYNDLTDTPVIPAEQIQSDWNQTNSQAKDFIKNKPILATVATSGSYDDLSDKPTIPEEVTVDTTLSKTSTNPVQNKVISEALEKVGNTDKSYDPTKHSGLGRKTLKLKEDGSNILIQEDFDAANTIYVIQYDFTLGEDITIPENCVLEFVGGSISGEHSLTGNDTDIQAGLVKIFNTDVTFNGGWNVVEVYPEWFGAKGDGVNDDTLFVRAAFTFGKGKRIVLNNEYAIYWYITIYSNTEVLLNGTCKQLRRDEGRDSIGAYPGGCFELYDRSASPTAYSGIHDVYFHGNGTIDLCNVPGETFTSSDRPCLRLCHNSNIKIEGITLRRYWRHAIEIGACENVTIKNCYFKGAADIDDIYGDTIQIECSTSVGIDGAASYDNIPTRKLFVDGCVFKPEEGGYKFNTCVGSHSNAVQNTPYDETDTYWYKDIIIRNCYFEYETQYEDIQKIPALRIWGKTDGWHIYNNVFRGTFCCISNLNGGQDKNITIKNNYFNISGITIIALGPSSPVSITNNTFVHTGTTSEHCVIMFGGICSGVVQDNHITILGQYSGKIIHTVWENRGNVPVSFSNNIIEGINNLTEEQKDDFKNDQITRFSIPNTVNLGDFSSMTRIYNGKNPESILIKISNNFNTKDIFFGVSYLSFDVIGISCIADIDMFWWNVLNCNIRKNTYAQTHLKVYKHSREFYICPQATNSFLRAYLKITKTPNGITLPIEILSSTELPADAEEIVDNENV